VTLPFKEIHSGLLRWVEGSAFERRHQAFGDFEAEVDPKSETAKPRKGPSQNRVWQVGTTTANQRRNKKLSDKKKLIESLARERGVGATHIGFEILFVTLPQTNQLSNRPEHSLDRASFVRFEHRPIVALHPPVKTALEEGRAKRFLILYVKKWVFNIIREDGGSKSQKKQGAQHALRTQ